MDVYCMSGRFQILLKSVCGVISQSICLMLRVGSNIFLAPKIAWETNNFLSGINNFAMFFLMLKCF